MCKIIFKISYDFWFWCHIRHFWILHIFVFFCLTITSKTASLNMFPTKCWGQNDCMGPMVMSYFCQNMDFIIGFAIKTSIFKSPPLSRFLYLVNSFYRRCVSSMYSGSNISNILSRFDRLNFFRLVGWSQHSSDAAIWYVRILIGELIGECQTST